MSKPQGIFTVVEFINERPAVTNYIDKTKAEEAFVKIVKEQFGDNLDYYKPNIDKAIKDKALYMDDYMVVLQETDLIA